MNTNKSTNTEKQQRKRKFFLWMPLFVLPFLTLLLWAIGMIGSGKKQHAVLQNTGINLQLPSAEPNSDSN